MQELHPQMFPKPRPVIRLTSANEMKQGNVAREAKVRQRPTMDRIRKLENELRAVKAVNLESKQIWMATMKDDVDKVEQFRQEV